MKQNQRGKRKAGATGTDLAKIRLLVNALMAIGQPSLPAAQHRASFSELAFLCAPLAAQAAKDGIGSYTHWKKCASFPLPRKVQGSELETRLRRLLIRWLRQKRCVDWASKNVPLMEKLRAPSVDTAKDAITAAIKNKRRVITHAWNPASNQCELKLSQKTEIPYKELRKSFESLPTHRKLLMEHHYPHLTRHEQDVEWKTLMASCGVAVRREPRYADMSYDEVVEALRKASALRARDIPSKLYEKIWREGWFSRLQDDGILAQYLVSAYGERHFSMYELIAANYLHEIGAHEHAQIAFEQPYPREFADAVGHPRIRSDIAITHGRHRLYVEITMYDSQTRGTKTDPREDEYRRKMSVKSELTKMASSYDGLETHFGEVPVSTYDKATGKKRMLGIVEFIQGLRDVLGEIEPIKAIEPPLTRRFIARLKKNHAGLAKEREAAMVLLTDYFAERGVDRRQVIPFINHVIGCGERPRSAAEQIGIPWSAIRGLSRVNGVNANWAVRIHRNDADGLNEVFTDLKHGLGDPIVSLAAAISCIASHREAQADSLRGSPELVRVSAATRRIGDAGVFGLKVVNPRSKYPMWVASNQMVQFLGGPFSVSVTRMGARPSLERMLSGMASSCGGLVTAFHVPGAAAVPGVAGRWLISDVTGPTLKAVSDAVLTRLDGRLGANGDV